MKKCIIGSLFIVLTTTVAAAENMINTQTNTWKSVPITVDDNNHTYSTLDGYLVPEGEYYYTYSGYRCLKNKVENTGMDPVIYKDKADEKNTIYCYSDNSTLAIFQSNQNSYY